MISCSEAASQIADKEMPYPTPTDKDDRNKNTPQTGEPVSSSEFSISQMTTREIFDALAANGVVMLGQLVTGERLERMQTVYRTALERPTWNTWIGFEQNEKWRRLIENLLIYDRAFVDHALYPSICEVLREYIGPGFELVEARGWETIATRRDFHGWHADAWYDENVQTRPREVKLACYLTDVETGHFQYVRGSHKTEEAPRSYAGSEVAQMADRILDLKGPAGSCFLFDTSGVHRQSSPVLKKRWVVMYNYHDPAIRVGNEHLVFGRYRPLFLNAAFVGGLTGEEQRVLGMGRVTNMPSVQPTAQRFQGMHRLMHRAMRAYLELQDVKSFVRSSYHGVRRRLARLARSNHGA